MCFLIYIFLTIFYCFLCDRYLKSNPNFKVRHQIFLTDFSDPGVLDLVTSTGCLKKYTKSIKHNLKLITLANTMYLFLDTTQFKFLALVC